MSAARAVQQTAQPATSNSPSLLLQRKCSCGGSAGLSGECNDCQSKRLLGKPLQTKLRIGAADDEFEREADHVADQVMRMPASKMTAAAPSPRAAPLVQRRVTEGSTAGAQTVPSIVHDVLSSHGQPLDAPTRTFFEPRFGVDFGHVRVHADASAAKSARAVGALAYTVGHHVVLGEGQHASRNLLAHELTHVVQQTGMASAQIFSPSVGEGRVQRQVPAEEKTSASADVSIERPANRHDLAKLQREFPTFARQLGAFSERFWDFFELLQGPLIRSGIFGIVAYIPEREQFNDYLDRLRRQEEYMNREGRYSPRDIHNWLYYVEVVLGAAGPLADRVEPQLSGDAQATEAIQAAQGQLPQLRSELVRLQNVSFIREEREEIAAEAQASRDAAAAETEFGRTLEGRRDAAVAHITAYVQKHWRPDLNQTFADVHAIELGRYLVYEQKFTGSDIQAVLEALRGESAEIYDRALFHGRLLVYLLTEGITGLNVGQLLSEETQESSEESDSQTAGLHISGAGFYEGFEITWLDLCQRVPLAAPDLAVPGPRDALVFQLGFDKGVLMGFGGALKDAFWDLVSTFDPRTYAALHDLLTRQLADEQWRFQTGAAMATQLHGYFRDFADDSYLAIGERFGNVAGFVLAQIFLTWVGAKAATLAAAALRATKWGKPLVEFAETVADAMPWQEPKIVDDVTGAGTLPELTAAETALLKRTGDSREYPGRLPKDVADQELDIAKRAETTAISEGEYIEAVDLGNGHQWKRKKDGTWCRFSAEPTNCTAPETEGGKAPVDAADEAALKDWLRTSLGSESDIQLDDEKIERLIELREEILGGDQAAKDWEVEFRKAKEEATGAKERLTQAELETAPHIESLKQHLAITSDESRRKTIKQLVSDLKAETAPLKKAANKAETESDHSRARWRGKVQQVLDAKTERFQISQANHLENLKSVHLERSLLKSEYKDLLSDRDRLLGAAAALEEKYLPAGRSVTLSDQLRKEWDSELEPIKQQLGPIKERIQKIDATLPGLDVKERRLHKQFQALQAQFEAQQLAGKFDSAVYLALRKRTPSQAIRAKHQAAKQDAIYGVEIQGTPEADHIVPMFRIVEMPGFQELFDENQLQVLNFKENFWALDKRVNASKGSKGILEWSGHPDFGSIPLEVVAQIKAKETELILKLQSKINELLAQQARGSK